MIEHKEHFHGSDLEKIEKIYGIKKEDIISFAANVNPLGVSPKLRESIAKHIDIITTYPDRDYVLLRENMATYCGGKVENIVVGNGSTELISLFIQINSPKKALILAPTYSEYEREIELCGGATEYFPLKEENDFQLDPDSFVEALDSSMDLVVICNPNNPTSSVIRQSAMRKILEGCKKNNTFVLVDETYVEFCLDENDSDSFSSVPLTEEFDNLVVLRGTSKFFAAPGLRLGYAICGNGPLMAEINKRKNPWTINSLAVVAGNLMFNDTDYINKTRDLMTSESKRMYDLFEKSHKYKPFKPFGNFMLLKILDESVDSHDLFDRCIVKGMMIRDCSTFPYLSDRYIRFCFMHPADNDRLAEELLK